MGKWRWKWKKRDPAEAERKARRAEALAEILNDMFRLRGGLDIRVRAHVRESIKVGGRTLTKIEFDLTNNSLENADRGQIREAIEKRLKMEPLADEFYFHLKD